MPVPETEVSLMSSVMAQIQKDYIYSKLLIGERVDGRSLTDIREISVKTGVIEKAEGSALVKMGETVVLVGVKMQPGTPFPDSPNSGVIISNVELSMIASPDFESGGPDSKSGDAIIDSSTLEIITPLFGESGNGVPGCILTPTNTTVSPIFTRAEPSAFSITPVLTLISLISVSERPSTRSPMSNLLYM